MSNGQAPAATAGNSFPRAVWFFLLLAVGGAPFLLGSVRSEGQGAAGLLLGAGLLVLVTSRAWSLGGVGRVGALEAALLLLAGLYLTPLPLQWVEVVSPTSAQWLRAFPVESDNAPRWASLSLSPAGTVQRLWQFLVLVAAFHFGRLGVADRRFRRGLVAAIGLAVGGLGWSELYYRDLHPKVILGLWEVTWGNSAGTFANRNHFAGWLAVAVLFLIGAVLRCWSPLRSARPSDVPHPPRQPWLGAVLLAVVLWGVAWIVLSGSRGGFLALMFGGGVWLLLLWRRSMSRRRRLLILLLGLAGVVVVTYSGDLLFRRLAQVGEHAAEYPKLRIWEDAWQLMRTFPLTGTGPGTFVRVHNHAKQHGGGTTVWHAENEYLQWLAELGLVGLGLLVVFGRQAWRVGQSLWRRSHGLPEPELCFGAFAAVAAFAFHSLADFPFQVFANALLVAVLAGMVAGWSAGPPGGRSVPASTTSIVLLSLVAALMMAAGGLQVWAYVQYRQGLAASKGGELAARLAALDAALGRWPWSVERHLPIVRLESIRLADLPAVDRAEPAALVRSRLNRTLARDPLNWELRLERAWFDVRVAPQAPLARDEVMEVIRLNPRQPLIPLQFARHYVNRDPEFARRLLALVDVSAGSHLRDVLNLAWELDRDASRLWSFVPANDAGFRQLAGFALDHRLPALATQALNRLTQKPTAVELASLYLELGRPDLAIEALPPEPSSPAERLLLARAYWRRGDQLRCLRHLEALWSRSSRAPEWLQPYPVRLPDSALLGAGELSAVSQDLARQIAEVEFRRPAAERDVNRLNQLAGRFPAELRLRWMLHRSHLDRHDYARAAETGIAFAELLLAPP